jgi:hypothetical protein
MATIGSLQASIITIGVVLIFIIVLAALLLTGVIVEGVYLSQVSNTANSIQTIQSVRMPTYTLTQTDISNSFAIVPVVWPKPFASNDYTAVFSVHNLGDYINYDVNPGDSHNYTPTGFNAVVQISGPQPLIIQAQAMLSIMAPVSSVTPIVVGGLYLLTLYIASHNDGSSTQGVQTYISYTDASGVGEQTFGYQTIGQIQGTGGSLNSQNFTFPLYCIAGSNITLTTAFVTYGTNTPIGTTFTYDFSTQLSQYVIGVQPTSVGAQLVVTAIGTLTQ